MLRVRERESRKNELKLKNDDTMSLCSNKKHSSYSKYSVSSSYYVYFVSYEKERKKSERTINLSSTIFYFGLNDQKISYFLLSQFVTSYTLLLPSIINGLLLHERIHDNEKRTCTSHRTRQAKREEKEERRPCFRVSKNTCNKAQSEENFE